MSALRAWFKNDNRFKLLLFICSLTVYTIYFHHIFFHLNSLLSSVTSDTLKNYYTYVYHIRHDDSALHFKGMNYPYGEHVVYTDCQPILGAVLRVLPFTHYYLVGILHFLIFFSFIITPVILFSVFRLLDVGRWTAFCAALGLALLSPQFLKINAGHHALAYGCLIPLSILLSLNYLKKSGYRYALFLFGFHCGLFLLHPYMGFGICLFSFLTLTFAQLIYSRGKQLLAELLKISLCCIFPVALFKLFMVLTDNHTGRTTEPYGVDVMVENVDSLLAPVFGPMKTVMETWFNKRPDHFEGHTYLGLTSILMLLFFVIVFPFTLKMKSIKPSAIALILSSTVLLLLSFGWHNTVFAWCGIDAKIMNQFRAACRFAWFFYFGLGIFLVSSLYHILKDTRFFTRAYKGATLLPALYLAINLWEAHFMFKLDEKVFWHFRNIFNENLLSDAEKTLTHEIKSNAQAIIPLPVYFSGSEMYDRTGFNNSMLASMFYSANSGVPVYSAMMSRTSITETEKVINLLNSYKQKREAAMLLNEKVFYVMRTADNLLADEQRLFEKSSLLISNDTLTVGRLTREEFLEPKLQPFRARLQSEKQYKGDSLNIVYIPHQEKRPFLQANQLNSEVIFVLDSNLLKPGKYCVSLKYHYTGRTFRSLASNLIISEEDTKTYEWKHDVPLRILSGFYDGFGVFEWPFEIRQGQRYEFFIQGRTENSYHISDFMIRPLNQLVEVVSSATGDTTFNNFPR